MNSKLWMASLLLAGSLPELSTTALAQEQVTQAECLLNSPAATDWMERNGWRYNTQQQADAAYARLTKDMSPWPDWYHPEVSVLQPGTRFQMAMSSKQPNTSPGGFATFDYLESVEQVRKYLAVLPGWKADINRMVTYEVKAPMLASIGPIGPQVDKDSCTLYTGEFTQVQFLVPPADRMQYLTYVSERTIK
ncbi:MAG: hypothetical protein WAT93_14115 [Pontixanthobacter sp.]